MTFYYAAYYFDDKIKHPDGYLLGIDDLIEIEITKLSNPLNLLDGEKEAIKILGEKILKGRDYIGLIAGSLQSIASNFSNPLRSLDNIFDEIQEGSYYGNVELLKDSHYTILLAKRHPEKIQLFEISSLDNFSGIFRFYIDKGGEIKQLKKDEILKHRAILLHELVKGSNEIYKGTHMWYSPNINKYFPHGIETLFTLEVAKDFLERLAQIPVPDGIGCPQRLNFYVVSYDRVG